MTRLPRYRQIANQIRQKIAQGEYRTGEPLPSEAQLREIFSVSRVTIRQALKLLVENDELESVRGSGSYVKENKINYDIYHQTSFAEKWADLGSEAHSEVLAFSVIKASSMIAEQLDITEKDKVYYVQRVRYLSDKPITVEETWLPTELFPDLSYQTMQGSKYQYIEQEKGLVIDRSEQEIIPILPPADIASLLGIDREQPIIEKRTRGYLENGTAFEYSRNFFRSGDYKFTLIAKRHKTN